jgi:hypothetical protein
MVQMSQVAKEVVKNALAYWDRIRGGRAMPARGDIDPADMPKLLPNIMLVDVLRAPDLDFVFRLIGTGVHAIISSNYRGKRFSVIPHMASGNKVWTEYAAVADRRRPFTGPVDYVGNDQYVRGIRHCLMPLSNDGESVNMIFVAVEIDRD